MDFPMIFLWVRARPRFSTVAKECAQRGAHWRCRRNRAAMRGRQKWGRTYEICMKYHDSDHHHDNNIYINIYIIYIYIYIYIYTQHTHIYIHTHVWMSIYILIFRWKHQGFLWGFAWTKRQRQGSDHFSNWKNHFWWNKQSPSIPVHIQKSYGSIPDFMVPNKCRSTTFAIVWMVLGPGNYTDSCRWGTTKMTTALVGVRAFMLDRAARWPSTCRSTISGGSHCQPNICVDPHG